MGWDHFRTVPRPVAGRCPDLPSGHFWTVPRSVARWRFLPLGHFSPVPRSVAGCSQICLKGIFGKSQGQTLGGKFWGIPIIYQSQGQSLGVPFLPDWDFWSRPKASRWEVVGFALGPFSTSPRVRRWVLHFCPRGIFGVVTRSIAGLCNLPLGHFA